MTGRKLPHSQFCDHTILFAKLPSRRLPGFILPNRSSGSLRESTTGYQSALSMAPISSPSIADYVLTYLCFSPTRHWQLRSLISAERQHIVYFPGGHGSNHIQRLNTHTRECETIKLLAFAPRCLVARNGWLCCGSENGEFVAIQLDGEGGNDDSRTSSLTFDPDARLPLNLDATRDEPLFSLIASAPRSNKSLIAKSMKMAKDRVNCVTMWFPSPIVPTYETAYKDPVAVLANNDRTVTLVSLYDFDQNEKTEPLEVITYPDFVNRAIISPDGRLLIAILDDPYLYVHERIDKSPPSSQRRDYRWEQRQRILLKSQRKDDRSDSRGSFAACFSTTGSFLAVGTQHGTISILNATVLTDPDVDPLITTFKSSRPESGPGAVRDMAFCPGPFDILAWTEDRGHIGLADMRSNFTVRQIVDINNETDFEHITILDRNTIDPRLLHNRHDRGDNTREASSSNSPARDGERSDLFRPLTTHETLVLQAIQVDRRRARERAAALRNVAASQREEASRDASETTITFSASSPRVTLGESDPQPIERSNSTGRELGDLLGTYQDQRERILERVRTRQPIRNANDRGQAGRRSEQRRIERIGDTVQAIRDQRERQDNSYMNVLEILQSRDSSTGDTERDDSALLLPLVNHVANDWEESAVRGTFAAVDHGVFEVPPSPDNTAGLAWSEDGRTL